MELAEGSPICHGVLRGLIVARGHAVKSFNDETTRDEFVRARYGEGEAWIEIQVSHSSTLSERHDQESWAGALVFPKGAALRVWWKYDYEKYDHRQDRDEWSNLDEAVRRLAAVCPGVSADDVKAAVGAMSRTV